MGRRGTRELGDDMTDRSDLGRIRTAVRTVRRVTTRRADGRGPATALAVVALVVGGLVATTAVPASAAVGSTATAVYSSLNQSATGDANLYFMGEGDFAQKLRLDPNTGAASLSAQSGDRAACGMPGGFLSVSSKGDDPKTAVVWANVPAADSLAAVVPATFYAYDAETMETLYRDESRATPGSTSKFAKFVAPTVANGRVYQAAFGPSDADFGSLNAHYSGSVVVYGLKSRYDASP